MQPTQEQLEDQLLDAILHAQNPSDQELALAAIEAALDSRPAPITLPVSSPWPRRLSTIAATVVLGGLLAVGVGAIQKSRKTANQVVPTATVADKAKARQMELASLDKAIRDQADKVEERRKVLATIAVTKGSGNDDKGGRSALRTYIQLEQEKMELASQINSLTKYDGDELMVYAAGLDLPDNIIKILYTQYLEAKRKVDSIKLSGMGDKHPTVMAELTRINTIKHQLDEGVVTLRATLQARLDMATDRLNSVTVMRDDTRENAIKRCLDAQDYVDAKRDFDKDQEVLAQMKQATGAPNNDPSASGRSIRDQEDKVEERRKALATIVRTKGIIYKGQDSFYGQSGVDEDQDASNREDVQGYVEVKKCLVADQEQLRQLKLRQNELTGGQNLEPAGQDLASNINPAKSVAEAPVMTLPVSPNAKKRDPSASTNPEIASKAPAIPAASELAKNDETKLLDANPVGRVIRPRVAPLPTDGAPIAAVNGIAMTGDSSTVTRSAPAVEEALVRDARNEFHEQEKSNTARYGALVDPTWKRSNDYPLSTFSIDVDNASYSNIRRFIRDGQAIPPDAVRIEECINAFDYNYAKPTDDKAFAVHTTLATCPWNEQHLLMKVGIKGREIPAEQRPVSNLVFLIDVSGSMQPAERLPLIKESLKLLLHQLDERDSVAFVVYAGREGVVLPPTKMTESGRVKALAALGKLESGGSTNGGAGIKRAYQIAEENFIKGGVNRVILATDGDFNVGITDQKQLVALVKERAAKNIYLTLLGVGTDNLNDSLMTSISKDCNGNYFYLDSIREGRKILLQRLSGTLITIAKDVKIQIEFNPQKVGSYRLIGYANRQLRNEDFNNDKVDAGDIGAGHTVTAFYEISPADAPQPNGGGIDPLKYQQAVETPKPAVEAKAPSDEWLTLKLRHKSPEGDISSLQESVVKGPAIRWQESDGDFSFASAVALFGMKLRGMDEAKAINWQQIRELATPGLKDDRHENRAEFIGMLNALDKRRD